LMESQIERLGSGWEIDSKGECVRQLTFLDSGASLEDPALHQNAIHL